MSSERRSVEPIVAEPSEAWRNLVYKADTKSPKGQRAAEMAETTWIRCEDAVSRLLNNVPGADNYSAINPRLIMKEADGLSPSSFYGIRKDTRLKRGVISVGRATCSITVRALLEEIATLRGGIDMGVASELPAMYLPPYLSELLNFAQAHPEDANGFLRAMYSEVLGQGCACTVKQFPSHPARLIVDPVSEVLSSARVTSLKADAEHMVRMVMDTGISAGLNGNEVKLEDVMGIDHLMDKL